VVGSVSLPKLLKKASVLCLSISLSHPLQADLTPDLIHHASHQKRNLYFNNALFVGGDGSLRGIILQDITCSSQKDHERITITLEINRNGEPLPLAKPPYYQIAIETKSSPTLTVAIWGYPHLHFDAKKVQSSFQTIPIVQNLSLFPKLEEDHWTFSMTLAKKSALEVYELSHPARIVLDIRPFPSKRQ